MTESATEGTGPAVGLKCSTCGRKLVPRDRGWRWSACQICGSPICFDHTFYIRTKVEGLYGETIHDTIRVCQKCRA